MRKIRLLACLVCLLYLAGCSVYKGTDKYATKTLPVDSLVRYVLRNNVSETGYFIEKGKIRTSSQEGKISLFFNLKYKTTGEYLISLRSITGMEAFRVYVSNDTVLINDRLNKVLLFGEPADFEKITGFPSELLRLIVGDFYPGRNIGQKETECMEGRAVYNGLVRGLLINYEIDCKRYKVKNLVVNTGVKGFNTVFRFGNFKNTAKYVPREMSVIDEARQIKIEVEINKITYPWYGEINFSAGQGYTTKNLR